MINRAPVTKNQPSLDGRVFCAVCGSEMSNDGQDYRCPRTSPASEYPCSTSPVDSAHLLRAVMARMISRLANDEMVRKITSSIKEATERNARNQRRTMEEAEAAISELNARRPAVLQLVEHGAKTYDEAADEISRLDQAAAGLAFESMVARNELDKIDFISDEDGIRDTVRDVETYLGGNSPEEAQELLDLLVRKVTVDNGGATIIYQEPMPSGDDPQGVVEDRLPLKQTGLP